MIVHMIVAKPHLQIFDAKRVYLMCTNWEKDT